MREERRECKKLSYFQQTRTPNRNLFGKYFHLQDFEITLLRI